MQARFSQYFSLFTKIYFWVKIYNVTLRCVIYCFIKYAWKTRMLMAVKNVRLHNRKMQMTILAVGWWSEKWPTHNSSGQSLKQISRAWTSNYIPQILWDVITCPCPWYLHLTHTSPYVWRCRLKHWVWSKWSTFCRWYSLLRFTEVYS